MRFLTKLGFVLAAAGDDYFTEFITEPAQPVIWFAVFVLLTSLIVIIGVEKGIEKASCTLMPILVVLTIGIGYFVKPQVIYDEISYCPSFCSLVQKHYAVLIR